MGRGLSIIIVSILFVPSTAFCQQDKPFVKKNQWCFSSSLALLQHEINGLSRNPHLYNVNKAPKTSKDRPSESDRWFGRDKANHFAVSAVLVGFGYYATHEELDYGDWPARNSAIGFSLTLGIFKEVYDWMSRKGQPSFKDIVADIAGIGVGFVMITLGD